MTLLDCLTNDSLWIRWRHQRRNPEGSVIIMANGCEVAIVTSSGWDWIIHPTSSDADPISLRRTARPPGIRGVLQSVQKAEYEVVVGDRAVGRIGRTEWASAWSLGRTARCNRMLVPADDLPVTFRTLKPGRTLYATPAEVVTGDGAVVVRVIGGRSTEGMRAAPADGLITDMDASLQSTPQASPEVRLLALAASLLVTALEEEPTPGGSGA